MTPKIFQSILGILLVILACAESRPSASQSQVKRSDNFDEKRHDGDIIFPPGFDPKNGLVGEFLRWPNATVIYTLDVDFTETELNIISEAMAEIEDKTCIRFQHRVSETAYVFVARGFRDTGCYSMLGRLGTPQSLNLEAPGCVHKGIVMHEFLHAIGFYHEQSREDRDDFVTINWNNIEPGVEFNFLKAVATLKYNVTYDYGSLMHYSAYSFATDSSIPTIIPLDPTAEIGQRNGLSPKDIYKVNAMYCPENNGDIPQL